MLWYKSWLETRSRFLIGLALLTIMACGVVLDYPTVQRLMPLADSISGTMDSSGTLGRLIKEGAEIQRDYRGFIWWQWFRQNLSQGWTLFAVLLGCGGLLSRSSGAASLFTLSLPVSRADIVGTRAATGLAELFALALVPSLMIPLLSPAVGQSYGFGSVVVYGLCLFVAGTTFFSLALLLSTVFGDIWRPLLIACAIAVVLSLAQAIPELARFSIFRVMGGDTYFHGGGLPWVGLVASAALSGAMLYGATVNIARQDY